MTAGGQGGIKTNRSRDEYREDVLANFVRCDRVARSMTRAVVELTAEGRPTVMLVPVTLQNGNLRT